MVNIDSELELVMLKKNLMITPRILHLNFEFKAEIRAGKSKCLQISIRGIRVRYFKRIWLYHTILSWGLVGETER